MLFIFYFSINPPRPQMGEELTTVAVCREIRNHLYQVREKCPDPTDFEQFAELYDLQKSQFLSKFPRHKFFWIKFAEYFAESWTESAVSFVARAEMLHPDQTPPVLLENEALIRDICKLFVKNRELFLDNKNLWKDNKTLDSAVENLIQENITLSERVAELSESVEKLMTANDMLMKANRDFLKTF